jgi:hypothetical protein
MSSGDAIRTTQKIETQSFLTTENKESENEIVSRTHNRLRPGSIQTDAPGDEAEIRVPL